MKITHERETQKKTKTEKNMKRGREAIMKGGELLFFFFLCISLSSVTFIISDPNYQAFKFGSANSEFRQSFLTCRAKICLRSKMS